MSTIVIDRQFRGPPNSGNGGYVCGVLARGLVGPVTAMIRAPVPLDEALEFEAGPTGNRLLGPEDAVIGTGAAAMQPIPDAPVIPTLAAARAASAGYFGHTNRVHPPCFTCSNEREEGDGLRVFPGQLEGAEPGVLACVWTPHAAFGGVDGLIPPEVVWAALDCPGFFAWIEKEGRHGALLGTMTGEILTPPRVGEDYIVLAWPIAREGRKETAGVALINAEGQILARAHQVWIVMPPRPPVAA
ncbi:hypothetical protein [Phenylobacterium sp.]|uniref:hypothetical protein n=1 Tax=Phenylobacterium sp. TaxID=1871053 RepID=UPI0037CB2461